MLRLALAVAILFFLFKYVWPHLRVMQVIKRERRARYNEAEWEKIKRELEKK